MKCERVYDVAKKIFRRIYKKTNITECEFDIIEKKSKKVYSYLGRVVRMKMPKIVKIGDSGFVVFNRYEIKRIYDLDQP